MNISLELFSNETAALAKPHHVQYNHKTRHVQYNQDTYCMGAVYTSVSYAFRVLKVLEFSRLYIDYMVSMPGLSFYILK